jgi:hypothetical protein
MMVAIGDGAEKGLTGGEVMLRRLLYSKAPNMSKADALHQ